MTLKCGHAITASYGNGTWCLHCGRHMTMVLEPLVCCVGEKEQWGVHRLIGEVIVAQPVSDAGRLVRRGGEQP